MRKFLRSVMVIVGAGLFTVACEESPPVPGGNSSSSATTSSTSAESGEKASASTVAVWPPTPDNAIIIAYFLQQVNIMVVYDGSGSMDNNACGASGNRHQSAVLAVKQFVNAVPNDANLGLYVFDNRGVDLRVPLGTNNKVAFNAALDKISIGSGTPLKSAITAAYYVLERQAQTQLGYGRYILLIVTDGEANTGQSPTRVVNYMVDNTPIEVHTVGLCIRGNHSLNQPGRTFYTDAQNPDQLIAGLTAALAEATEDEVTF